MDALAAGVRTELGRKVSIAALAESYEV